MSKIFPGRGGVAKYRACLRLRVIYRKSHYLGAENAQVPNLKRWHTFAFADVAVYMESLSFALAYWTETRGTRDM